MLKPWQRAPQVSCSHCADRATARVTACGLSERQNSNDSLTLTVDSKPSTEAVLTCASHSKQASAEILRATRAPVVMTEAIRSTWHRWLTIDSAVAVATYRYLWRPITAAIAEISGWRRTLTQARCAHTWDEDGLLCTRCHHDGPELAGFFGVEA